MAPTTLMEGRQLELVLRAFDQLPVHKNPLSGFQKADSTLGWIGKPDYRGRFRSAEFDVLVEHDDLGFRLADYEGSDAAAALPAHATPGWPKGETAGSETGQSFQGSLQAWSRRAAILLRRIFAANQDGNVVAADLPLRRVATPVRAERVQVGHAFAIAVGTVVA